MTVTAIHCSTRYLLAPQSCAAPKIDFSTAAGALVLKFWRNAVVDQFAMI